MAVVRELVVNQLGFLARRRSRHEHVLLREAKGMKCRPVHVHRSLLIEVSALVKTLENIISLTMVIATWWIV